MALTLAACSTVRVAPDKPGFNIPGPPKYLAPIAVPRGTPDMDARELAIKRRHALEEANGRLSKGRAAWLKMKAGVARK